MKRGEEGKGQESEGDEGQVMLKCKIR